MRKNSSKYSNYNVYAFIVYDSWYILKNHATTFLRCEKYSQKT